MNRLQARYAGNLSPQYTVSYLKDGAWWVGVVLEVPGVISQGKTKEELLENLRDALDLMLASNREEAVSSFAGRKTHTLQLA